MDLDPSMLYPQLSPYHNNNRHSSYDGYEDPTDRHHARSVSRRSAPEYLTEPFNDNPLAPTSVPRSPTYPPAGRGRMNSSSGLGDAAFADEAEYRLFVEATAGLGPDLSFRPYDPTSSPDSTQMVSPLLISPRRTQSDRVPTLNTTSPGNLVSPLSETPTTRFALQQLAQMPHGSLEPLQTAHPAVDMWLQPPSAEPEDADDLSQIEHLGLDDGLDFDDELPGYAESQAQAQQHQRAEAARRAQELQRRWQLSGGRRGL
ncbi:uncharacterized protein LTR77_002534 [Saxophila tyrrhenica]|uniref:Uncharacterized protein n=1 Tax=Saxophila tyrrhenica TaxID=1690608 RepID=A0AAV9PK12_9PEZI|nr:hypothetical protein LTR77_002534 [Saxophila tyrrhenica]